MSCPHCQAGDPSVWDDVLDHYAHPDAANPGKLKFCLSAVACSVSALQRGRRLSGRAVLRRCMQPARRDGGTMSDDLEYVRRAVALRDSVEAAFRNYLDGSGFDAKQLAVEVTKLFDDRKVLQAEVDRLTKLLPRCLGEWVSGSGGHRKYTGGCSNPGVWDVGLGFVCDAHKNKNGGDDDAWRWEEEEERLRSENDRLSKALVDACTTFERQ